MAQERTDRITFDPTALDDAQRDGVACVRCGDDIATMRPVGTLDGVQVFACLSHDGDAPDDTMSFDAVEGDLVRIIKRLEDAVASHDPAALDYAIRTARPCLERVRAWLDAREATK